MRMNVTRMVMEAYEVPMVKVMEVDVEKGFAASSTSEPVGDRYDDQEW